MSLAKYLFIAAEEKQPLSTYRIQEFLTYMLERMDLRRDIHFQTNTTIDTLDYSGTGLNSGSKVIFAAAGEKKRELSAVVPDALKDLPGFGQAAMVMPGVAVLQGGAFASYTEAEKEIGSLCEAIEARGTLEACPMIILSDDSSFISATLENFLWATFTRSNPSHDIYGVNSYYEHKHWACDNVIIDARMKPHQAPPLIPDPNVEQAIQRFFAEGGSLSGIKRS
ncbi:4-hydroxybenzoate decarboxylase subunit C [compost metagenome]